MCKHNFEIWTPPPILNEMPWNNFELGGFDCAVKGTKTFQILPSPQSHWKTIDSLSTQR